MTGEATRAARRVLFFSAYTGLGGGETSLIALWKALDPAAVRPLLVCPRDGRLPAAARALGIETRLVPYRGASVWFVPALTGRGRAAHAVARVARELAPDVIQTDFHSLPLALAAGRGLRVPIVFMCWGWWFRPKPWQRGVYRRDVALVLAGSDAIRRGFLGNPPFMPPDRVRLVHPGVDPAVFVPRRGDAAAAIRHALDLPPAQPLVTLVARFQHVKGHDVFLAAARRIANIRPDVTFAIAGENAFGVHGDEAFGRRVVAAARADAVLRDRVRFLGWTDTPEALIGASDVVVCSSRFESFGMVGVEAMSCAVPVVSTNAGGPGETIVDGETGFLAPPERPDLIAERVLSLLADETLRRDMGNAGRRHVESRFTIGAGAAAWRAAIEDAAAGRTGPGAP